MHSFNAEEVGSQGIRQSPLKHIMNEFRDAGVDIFKTSLIDREAFRAIRSFGGTVNDLDPRQVSGIDKATANAHALAVEVIERIKGIKKERGQNHD